VGRIAGVSLRIYFPALGLRVWLKMCLAVAIESRVALFPNCGFTAIFSTAIKLRPAPPSANGIVPTGCVHDWAAFERVQVARCATVRCHRRASLGVRT